MPNKRSRRKKTAHFFCHLCQERLWRTGTPKYNLVYSNPSDIRKNTGISSKKCRLIVHRHTTYFDTNNWIEGFYCPNHGQVWLLISRQGDIYKYRPANESDWRQTNNTIDPGNSNPSVSEFTQRMSRGYI